MTTTTTTRGGLTADTSHQPSAPVRIVAGVTRLALGWVFLWAFLDKTFGLGYATEGKDAWLDGGSPTFGFLKFGAAGPFKDTYNSIAGDAWADWLFMLGLLGIGLGLLFGVMMRSRLTTAAFVSASRRTAEAISTGWMPLRKVFANALLTARSRPFSKLSSSPTGLLWHADRYGHRSQVTWGNAAEDEFRMCETPEIA